MQESIFYNTKQISENKYNYYIVMEYMEGGTLAAKIKQQPFND